MSNLFSEEAKRIRIHLGLTPEEFAQKLDISPAYVYAVEDGRGEYHFETVNRIEEILGVNVNSLLDVKDPIPEAIKSIKSESVIPNQGVFEEMVTLDPSVANVFAQARNLAKLRDPILISGERGTGKHSLALMIHRYSNNHSRTFMVFNGYPERKGSLAFRGKGINKLWETGEIGSLYIEEIADLSLSDQFEMNNYLRTSQGKSTQNDTRIIAGTQKDISKLIDNSQFRNDLYFTFIQLNLPPLHKRQGDIIRLINFFNKKYSDLYKKEKAGFSSEAEYALLKYPWPGNISELESCIQKAILVAKQGIITPEDLNLFFSEEKIGEESQKEKSFKLPLKKNKSLFITIPIGTPLDVIEREIIKETLKATGGDKNIAAKVLNISPRTIYRKLNELDQKEDESNSQKTYPNGEAEESMGIDTPNSELYITSKQSNNERKSPEIIVHPGKESMAISGSAALETTNPIGAERCIERGKRFEEEGRYELATEEYEKAIAFNPNDGRAYLGAGLNSEKIGKREQAVRYYRMAIKLGNEEALEFLRSMGAR
jgi:DNA-binding NtrC family response regulator